MKQTTILLVLSAMAFLLLQEPTSAQFFNRNKIRNPKPLGTAQMRIETAEFGKTADGKTVEIFKLDNGRGITVEVLSLGGVIYSFNVPDKNGTMTNISANLETVAEYEKARPFFGALVGRYGNRIAKGKFTLDGKEYSLPINNGLNSLHGGNKGFDTVVWDVKTLKGRDYVGLELTYTSA
ncbi:MAG: hypothetical protein LBI18_05420, partial [Planctomycetaceae bacterium]|nr:hypothetical protein [Planctomycetaceae bacterium]